MFFNIGYGLNRKIIYGLLIALAIYSQSPGLDNLLLTHIIIVTKSKISTIIYFRIPLFYTAIKKHSLADAKSAFLWQG